MTGKFCGLNVQHLQRERKEGLTRNWSELSPFQQLERIFAHKFQEVAFACLQEIIHRKGQFIIKVTAHHSSQKGEKLPTAFAHLYYCGLEKEELLSCLSAKYQSAKSDFGQGIHFHRGPCFSTLRDRPSEAELSPASPPYSVLSIANPPHKPVSPAFKAQGIHQHKPHLWSQTSNF